LIDVLTLAAMLGLSGSYNGCPSSHLCLPSQVRGFAPIGMLECWNIGKMGFGIMDDWVNGNNRLEVKIKNE
jgi:hypothetical protein